MTDNIPHVARWWNSPKGMYIMITNIMITLETVITSEVFSQIYKDIEKGEICGTVF